MKRMQYHIQIRERKFVIDFILHKRFHTVISIKLLIYLLISKCFLMAYNYVLCFV